MGLEYIYVKEINKNIEILYEDNHIIVCVKPEGVLSQKDNSGTIDMLTIIKRYLKEKYNKPGDVYLGLVHRLDQRVEGVMVFGKTSKASSRLSLDIQNHNFSKTYVACVLGVINDKGVLENYLDKIDGKAVEVKNGKYSKLEYFPYNHFNLDEINFTCVKINLITGRYNQIRKQMSIFRHPLINDFKYGYREKNFSDSLGLRCVKIGFTHPVKKEYMEFSALKSISYSNIVWKKYLEERYE